MTTQRPDDITVFPDISPVDQPRLTFAFQVRLWFKRTQHIPDMPSGAMRGAVYLDDGVIEGPMLRGRAVPNSGGDYALFRPDDVLGLDAQYMLESHDGALILIRNRGYIWGRTPDVMPRFRKWALEGGDPVPHSEYYFRTAPTFEVSRGPYDWLMRHVFVGIGERQDDGNLIRYFAVG